MSRGWRRGLYAITDCGLIADERLPAAVEAAIRGGAVLIQFRDKRSPSPARTALARSVLQVCRTAGVPLIVNDDLDLAAEIEADGIHLGRDDVRPAEARARLGSQALLGASCYDRYANAERALEAGVDYVAFGRFFPSRTKPGAVPADPALLRQAAGLGLPVVAIGGITPENGRTLIDAGADLLAVVHGVFGQPDVGAAAAAYARLFDK